MAIVENGEDCIKKNKKRKNKRRRRRRRRPTLHISGKHVLDPLWKIKGIKTKAGRKDYCADCNFPPHDGPRGLAVVLTIKL
jgi:hypothetical protein